MRGRGEEHLTTVSKELHWLPVREWIHHKKTTSRISSGVKLGHSRTVLAKKKKGEKKKKRKKKKKNKKTNSTSFCDIPSRPLRSSSQLRLRTAQLSGAEKHWHTEGGVTSGRSPIQQPELWAAQPQTIRAVQPSLAVKQTLAEMWFSQRLHPPPPPHPPTPPLTPSTYIALTVHYASSPWLEMIFFFFFFFARQNLLYRSDSMDSWWLFIAQSLPWQGVCTADSDSFKEMST